MSKFDTSNPFGEVKDYLVGSNVIIAKEECHCKPQTHWNIVAIKNSFEIKLFTFYNEADIDAVLLKAREELFNGGSSEGIDKKVSNMARRLLVEY